jgi:hypothetical protein
MGFAIALFASAANGSLSGKEQSASRRKPNRKCEKLFMKLMCSDDLATTTPRPIVIKDDLSLYSVFRLLWERYENDERQPSICARVLAFHFLMARTAGGQVTSWVNPSTSGPQAVALDPVVVEALARICLLQDGLIDEDHFLNEIESVRCGADRTEHRTQPTPARARCVPASDSNLNPADFPFGHSESRLLAERLLAYETTSPEDSVFAASRVHKKLRVAFASMVGLKGFQSWAGRAKTLTEREGIAFDLASVDTEGELQRLPAEKAEAAAAFFGHLIALPDRLIGKSLMLRLLQEVWPGLLEGWQSVPSRRTVPR